MALATNEKPIKAYIVFRSNGNSIYLPEKKIGAKMNRFLIQ